MSESPLVRQPDRFLPPEVREALIEVIVKDQREKALKGMFRAGEEYRQGSEGRRWVVENLLPEGYLALLGATSKAGKSCFATAMAMAVCKGEPFLGERTSGGAVLWCAYEETEEERLDVLNAWPEVPANLYTTHDHPMIDEPEGLEALEFWVRKTKARLLVIDPLYGATNAESLADGRIARRALSGLKELCRKTKVAALVLHHITKDASAGMTRERFADSNQLLATASMDLLMDAREEADGTRFLKISGRGRGGFANRTWYVRSTGVTDFQPIPESEAASQAASTILAAVQGAPKPLTSNEIANLTGIPLQTVRNQLTRLVEQQRLATPGKRGKSILYAINLHPKDV